jgi:translation elongation factor EF-Ts
MSDDKKVPIDLIKQLKDKTGCGILNCKKALIKANNDIEFASKIVYNIEYDEITLK